MVTEEEKENIRKLIRSERVKCAIYVAGSLLELSL
jgi:hypothetical protein